MKAWKAALVAGLLAASSMTQAQEATIALTPAPEWAQPLAELPVPDDAQGPFFVRQENTITRLSATGQANYFSRTLRILQPQALQLGNVAITWNPAAGTPEVHSLRIRRGERVIDVLDKTQFEIMRREDQLEAAMLDGLLTATLRVPDLRIGDDLEITYTVPGHDPTLGATSHGMMFLADSPPEGRFRLELAWEDGQEPKTRLTDDFSAIANKQTNRLVVAMDNPDPVVMPANAPARFQWARVIEYSDFSDWSAVSRRFFEMYAAASALPADSALKQEAADIAAVHSGKLARARAALELVQQQVRYVYIGLDGGNYTPASADDTWDRRYGDCKGKTVMLLALLSELGIEAHPVLVSNSLSGDGFDSRLPNPGLFDHVLVRARIDGKTYWLDGTLPDVIGARTTPLFSYTWVLPLSARGSDLEPVKESPFDIPQEMELYEIDARAGFDEPARWTHTTVLRGAAALEQHMVVTSVSAGQLEAAVRNNLTGSGQWDSVESVKYRFDRAKEASILTITGVAPVKWEKVRMGGFIYRLPGGGFSPPERRQRGSSADKDVPFYQPFSYTCHVTSLRLPQDTDLRNWHFNSTFDTMLYGRAYFRAMELKPDRSLRLVRGSRVEEAEIAPQKAARDNQRLADFDDSMAVVMYYPDEIAEKRNSRRSVPATWEFDWTGRDAPCLPPDLLKPQR
ncbi:MAG: DUF3857 domain-containing transglutaminase family protein [Erythrobacter sp.]